MAWSLTKGFFFYTASPFTKRKIILILNHRSCIEAAVNSMAAILCTSETKMLEEKLSFAVVPAFDF